MPWKTITPTSEDVKTMSEILENMSVETLIQDAVSDMTLEEQQELVDDSKKAISEYISGTAQYYEGSTKALFQEIYNETLYKYGTKTIKRGKVKSS